MDVLTRVDHLVYAAADLSSGISEIEARLGVRASLGGRHPEWGTRNALAALGERSYLEIIAPDPDLRSPSAGRPFGLDALGPSRLAAWAANGSALQSLRETAARNGVALGSIRSGSRQQPDGNRLDWTLTDLRCVVAGGVVPFFIDWKSSPHPALHAPKGAVLVALVIEHPDAEMVRRMLHAIGIDLPVEVGPAPAVVAEIDCPRGRVILR
jgi:hypothetical protein